MATGAVMGTPAYSQPPAGTGPRPCQPAVGVPHESRIMHGHNELFQNQLRVMHHLVEEQKRMPGGYSILEQALRAGYYSDGEYDGLTSEGGDESYARYYKGKKRRQWKHNQQVPTPETGCNHGESYCKGLCRSCYQRWRRIMSKGDSNGDSKSLQSGTTGEVFSADSEELESEEDESMVGDSNIDMANDANRRRPGPAGRKRLSEEIEPAVFRRPPKKLKEMCVQCAQRPILCRALCNGCYQRWHKARKIAAQQGLPEVPCPSVAILEERAKKAAEAEGEFFDGVMSHHASAHEGGKEEEEEEAAAAAAARNEVGGGQVEEEAEEEGMEVEQQQQQGVKEEQQQHQEKIVQQERTTVGEVSAVQV